MGQQQRQFQEQFLPTNNIQHRYSPFISPSSPPQYFYPLRQLISPPRPSSTHVTPTEILPPSQTTKQDVQVEDEDAMDDSTSEVVKKMRKRVQNRRGASDCGMERKPQRD